MCRGPVCAFWWFVISAVIGAIVLVRNDSAVFGTYRAAYPAEKIEAIAGLLPVNIPIRTNFYVEGFSIKEFESFRQAAHKHGIASITPTQDVLADFHTCMEEEDFDEVLQKRNLGRHKGLQNSGQVEVYFLASNRSVTDTHAKVHLGKYRIIWVETSSLASIGMQKFVRTMKNFFYSPPPPYPGSDDDISLVQGFGEYHIGLTLLNMDPEAWVMDWDIETVRNYYLEPFIKGLSELTDAGEISPVDIQLDTQLVQHGSIPKKPKWNATLEAFTIPINSMERILLVNDWKLDSFSNHRQSKNLNFIILIPSSHVCPLVLVDGEGVPIPSNSFIFPDWGGVIVHCPSNSTQLDVASPVPYHLLDATDLLQPITQWTAQMRQLLGITWSLNVPESWHYLGKGEVAYWELDLWHRHLIQTMATSSINTIVSFHQTVSTLQTLPVGDHIAYATQRTLDYIRRAAAGGYYGLTLQRAQVALQQSENIFFDESLLANLYFPRAHQPNSMDSNVTQISINSKCHSKGMETKMQPDQEHTLAVFAPFFLPCTFALVIGAVHIVKAWRTEQKALKAKQEEKSEQRKND